MELREKLRLALAAAPVRSDGRRLLRDDVEEQRRQRHQRGVEDVHIGRRRIVEGVFDGVSQFRQACRIALHLATG